VTFGSMPDPNPEALRAMVLGALTRNGQRAVIVSSAGALGQTPPPPPDIFQIATAPLDWLFPRVRAVVHHGGAGTTATALMAGVPQVVVPFLSDQPFWGDRVYALGAGPRPIARRQLTTARLEQAISSAIRDESMRGRARGLKQLIQSESGVSRAIEVLEQYLARESHQ
jgi:sterol 3beta-glucosyltransferase